MWISMYGHYKIETSPTIPDLALLTKNSKTKGPNTRFSTFDNLNSKAKQPDARLNTSDNQNNKTVRQKVPLRHSSLKANYEQVTADLSVQLSTDKAEFLTAD